MSVYGVVITNAGASLFAQAVGGQQLTFTRARLGNGIYNGDLRARTTLVSPVRWAGLGTVEVDIGQSVCSVPVNFSNVDGDGYFPAMTINEIGLYATVVGGTETMVAYANAGEDYDGISIPGDALTEFVYNFLLTISNLAQINLNNRSIAYPTRAEMNDALALKSDVGHTHAASDITSGILTVGFGGTGLSELAAGYVPEGTGGNAMTARKIATGVPEAASTDLMTSQYAYAALISKADRGVPVEFTIPASAWAADKTCTRTVNGVTGSNFVVLSMPSTATAAERRAARNAQIYCTGQSSNRLSFIYDGLKPDVTIPLLAMIMGSTGTDAADSISEAVTEVENLFNDHRVYYDADDGRIVVEGA